MDQAARFGVDVERLNQGRNVLTLAVTLDKIIHLIRSQVRKFPVQCHHCLWPVMRETARACRKPPPADRGQG